MDCLLVLSSQRKITLSKLCVKKANVYMTIVSYFKPTCRELVTFGEKIMVNDRGYFSNQMSGGITSSHESKCYILRGHHEKNWYRQNGC